MKFGQKSSKGGPLKEIKNAFEDIGSDVVGGVKNAFTDSFQDLNNSFFNSPASTPKSDPFNQSPGSGFDGMDQFGKGFEQFGKSPFGNEKKEPVRPRKVEMIFNYREAVEERRVMSEIRELMKSVKQEIEMLKMENSGLVSDISKMTVEELPAKPGIYHLRFLEFIIKILRSIRRKMSEGRLWLDASFEKKGKRKHRSLAKRKGTAFSMSKELTQANTPG
ncbi:MAG: DUF5660 family protein [Patescibacteria group bacterium]|jgi:hypothetical protein